MLQEAEARKRPRRRTQLRRDSGESRNSILEAATAEFAEKGYDGGRMDDIARRASISKNSLYYYFSSKEQLFIAVLESIYATIRSRHNDLSIRGMNPEDGMRALVRFTADIWIEHPDFSRLLASENLHRARHIRQSDTILNMYNPLLETIQKLLKDGSEAGVFRADIDPVDIYISIAALSAYYTAHHYTFDALFNSDLMAPDRLEQRIRHAETMILRYVSV